MLDSIKHTMLEKNEIILCLCTYVCRCACVLKVSYVYKRLITKFRSNLL